MLFIYIFFCIGWDNRVSDAQVLIGDSHIVFCNRDSSTNLLNKESLQRLHVKYDNDVESMVCYINIYF